MIVAYRVLSDNPLKKNLHIVFASIYLIEQKKGSKWNQKTTTTKTHKCFTN